MQLGKQPSVKFRIILPSFPPRYQLPLFILRYYFGHFECNNLKRTAILQLFNEYLNIIDHKDYQYFAILIVI